MMDKKLAEQGMMLLYAVPWPPQGIYSKKPLASAADLKGMKWRAYSPATSAHRRTGRRAAGHGAGRRSQPGLGHRRGREHDDLGSTGADTKLYEHVKYWYDTQAWLPKNAVLVNKAAFDALDAPTQAGAAEGRRRCRSARLGGQQEGQQRIAGQAQGRRHEDPAAERRS